MVSVYNYLGGKNLCNIVANIVVRKIEESYPNADTDISVINLGVFFVVRGVTSSNKVINIAQSLQDVLKSHNEDLSNKIKVIDTISYNKSPEQDYLNISFTYSKIIKNYKSTLNKFSNDNSYLNISLDDNNKIIYYCQESFNQTFNKELFSNYFENFTLIEKKCKNNTYISDRFYGLSICNEKYYHLILRNITHHLFSLSISDYTNFSINSTNKIESINNLNINLNLNDTKCIVKKEWLESIILDIFPFEINSLKEYFNVDLNNEFEYLINSGNSPYWEKNKLINEIILL